MFSKFSTSLFEAIGKLTKTQRILMSVGAFMLLIGVFFGLSLYPRLSEFKRLYVEIDDLERKIAVARSKAKQLPRYREMMKQAEADLKSARRVLPEKKEIPTLLTGISRAGNEAGLEFYMFMPKEEAIQTFYAEIPVTMRVKAPFHNIVLFFDKVARLFRLVNISDFTMRLEEKSQLIDTTCTAVTYRFIEPKKETETQNQKKDKKK